MHILYAFFRLIQPREAEVEADEAEAVAAAVNEEVAAEVSAARDAAGSTIVVVEVIF